MATSKGSSRGKFLVLTTPCICLGCTSHPQKGLRSCLESLGAPVTWPPSRARLGRSNASFRHQRRNHSMRNAASNQPSPHAKPPSQRASQIASLPASQPASSIDCRERASYLARKFASWPIGEDFLQDFLGLPRTS